jgi:hypothetical protein
MLNDQLFRRYLHGNFETRILPGAKARYQACGTDNKGRVSGRKTHTVDQTVS